MQGLLIFLLVSAIFVFGYACFIRILWTMMQEDQAFDTISSGGFTKYKEKMYSKSSIGKLKCKILGDCEQCTAFWWSFPWFVFYFIFCYSAKVWCLNFLASGIWFIVFCCICGSAGYWILTHKKDPA